MEKKDLLLDVDEVICFSGFLDATNKFMGTNHSIDDYTDYYIDNVAIPDYLRDEFNKFLSDYNLYQNATLLPDCYEVIEALLEYYNIYILSSCFNPLNPEGSGRMFKDKYDFLYKSLPIITPDRFIFTSSKDLVKGDILVDDRLQNLKGSFETKILFPSYHNKEITGEELSKYNVTRAGYDYHTGWKEVEKILMKKV